MTAEQWLAQGAAMGLARHISLHSTHFKTVAEQLRADALSESQAVQIAEDVVATPGHGIARVMVIINGKLALRRP